MQLEVRVEGDGRGKGVVVVDDADLAAALGALFATDPATSVTVRPLAEVVEHGPRILVNRVGFHRTGDDTTPEIALQWMLNQMRAKGHRILTVAVVQSPRPADAYEAFIVSEVDT